MMRVLLLDLDETLVDTREHVIECNRRVLAARGYVFTREQLRERAVHGSLRPLRHSLGITDAEFYGAEGGVFTHRAPMTESVARGDVTLLPGAIAFLTAARAAGWRVAIITNTDRGEVTEKVKLLGVTVGDVRHGGLIEALSTVEQGAPRKPDPTSTLRALADLGVDGPSGVKLVCIGDLPTDMEVAVRLRALGYDVTAVLLNHYDESYLVKAPHADRVIASWDDGIAMLREF